MSITPLIKIAITDAMSNQGYIIPFMILNDEKFFPKYRFEIRLIDDDYVSLKAHKIELQDHAALCTHAIKIYDNKWEGLQGVDIVIFNHEKMFMSTSVDYFKSHFNSYLQILATENFSNLNVLVNELNSSEICERIANGNWRLDRHNIYGNSQFLANRAAGFYNKKTGKRVGNPIWEGPSNESGYLKDQTEHREDLKEYMIKRTKEITEGARGYVKTMSGSIAVSIVDSLEQLLRLKSGNIVRFDEDDKKYKSSYK